MCSGIPADLVCESGRANLMKRHWLELFTLERRLSSWTTPSMHSI